MAVSEHEIWQQLLTTRHGKWLRWNDKLTEKAWGDLRFFHPERFMVMNAGLKPYSEYSNPISSELVPSTKPNTFIAPNGEFTGTIGLLQTIERFPIVLEKPKEVLLVGAIHHGSLYATLKFCESHGWTNTHVTLVDKSVIPIEVIKHMLQAGYIDWPGGLTLIEGDVTKIGLPNRPQVIISDILSSWMVSNFSYPNLESESPYVKYANYLNWAAETVSEQGWFFNRSMITPEKLQSDPNLKSTVSAKQRADQVINQIGVLAASIDRQWLEEEVEDLFDPAFPESFCGLEMVYDTYKSIPNLTGIKAEQIIADLHKQTFHEVHQITIQDSKTGFHFLNFANRGKLG